MKIKSEAWHSFPSTGDFELGLGNITRSTQYFLVKPEREHEKLEGLVVYIPGFGSDAGDYRFHFCRKIAEQYGYAAMTVDYHCLFCRPETPDKVDFEPQDIKEIEKLFLKYDLPFQGKTVQEGLDFLNTYLVEHNLTVQVTATILPEKEEYQSGGMLQALDIINAVEHAIQHEAIPSDNIILVGSSFGGYIANLAAKLAPNTFSAVMDNSSWAYPNYAYVVGRECNQHEFSQRWQSNVLTRLFVKTPWTLKKGFPFTFDENRTNIRSFSPEQVAQQGQYSSPTQYIFVHSETDQVAQTGQKIQMAESMIQVGMNVHMEVYGQKDVDGNYVKNLNHGMDLSMLTFFEKALPAITLNDVGKKTDFVRQSQICYDSHQYRYCFDFSSFPVKASVTTVNHLERSE